MDKMMFVLGFSNGSEYIISKYNHAFVFWLLFSLLDCMADGGEAFLRTEFVVAI